MVDSLPFKQQHIIIHEINSPHTKTHMLEFAYNNTCTTMINTSIECSIVVELNITRWDEVQPSRKGLILKLLIGRESMINKEDIDKSSASIEAIKRATTCKTNLVSSKTNLFLNIHIYQSINRFSAYRKPPLSLS